MLFTAASFCLMKFKVFSAGRRYGPIFGDLSKPSKVILAYFRRPEQSTESNIDLFLAAQASHQK
jgi:hypothetical protein